MGNIRRETDHERLLTLGNELGVVEGEVGGGWGVGVTGWPALRGALDAMSTGCYSVC